MNPLIYIMLMPHCKVTRWFVLANKLHIEKRIIQYTKHISIMQAIYISMPVRVAPVPENL